MGIILATNKEYGKACKDFNKAKKLIDEGFSKQGRQGVFAKDYKQQESRLEPWKDYLGC